MNRLLSAIRYVRDGNWSHPAFTQSYDLLVLVTEGKLVYTANGHPIELEAGDLLYVPEGTTRSGAACEGLGHRKLGIRFRRSEWGELATGMPVPGTDRPFKLRAKRFHWAHSRFTELYNELKDRRPCYESVCGGIFLEVLGALNRELAEQSSNGSFERQVYAYIRDHYTHPLTVGQLARQAGKSETYLITAFRRRYGEPPLACMHRLRIDHACSLLSSTNLSVEEIALQLGYCDASYFYRMFRNRTGMSPAQFRKEQ